MNSLVKGQHYRQGLGERKMKGTIIFVKLVEISYLCWPFFWYSSMKYYFLLLLIGSFVNICEHF